MTSTKRREGRRQRRGAARQEKRAAATAPYDNFENIACASNLYRAFLRCRKGVAWKESTQRYEANALKNVFNARKKLLSGESVHLPFVCFALRERGKIRNIKSIHISERVIQKCLCDESVAPLLARSLIYDNGACLKNKGVHFCLRRLKTHLSRYYRETKSNEGYVLRIDITKFFDSIDHMVLFDMLENTIHDRRVLHLLKTFIADFGAGKSLGLGSQVSQVCALFYLNTLDHFIKERLRVKYYGRYMDDMYLIHGSKEFLTYCRDEIEKKCAALKLNVNTRKSVIRPLCGGFEFLKGTYTLSPGGRVMCRPCKDTVRRMRRKLKKFKNLFERGAMSMKDIAASYQSWRGMFRRRFDANHTLRRMDALYSALYIYPENR